MEGHRTRDKRSKNKKKKINCYKEKKLKGPLEGKSLSNPREQHVFSMQRAIENIMVGSKGQKGRHAEGN